MKDILKEKKTETFTVLKNYEGKRRKKIPYVAYLLC